MEADQVKNKEENMKRLQKSYFDVLGLCCSSEVPLIENILKPLEGVEEISVIVPTRTVIVVHDDLLISQIQIVKVLNQARLEANIRIYGEDNDQKIYPSKCAMASGLLLLVSFLKYVYPPMQWAALGAVAVGIVPIVLKAFAAIRNLRIDINILLIIAVIGTIAMKDYLEAGTIVFLFTISEWLESRASHKANVVMSSLMSISPKKAVIAETGELVDADEVKLNTTLAVKAGEVIPIDGIVVEGKCEVDEKTLTGETFPVAKQKDSTVFAGTINLNGYISVRTTALAEDCVVAKMAKLVEEAQLSKSRTQRFIDKCAKFYTPAVLVISVCFAVIPAALRVHNRNHWFHLALVVLVSACPCALILSTPVATFCALTRAATSGILIKGGDYLEVLSKIKVMAFDKTGTITRGEFLVMKFQPLQNDISLNTLLYWVSSIESKSSHPMAEALVNYGRSAFIDPKPENVENFENFPGEGVYGKIDGKDIYIGSRKLASRTGCRTVPSIDEETKEGRTLGYIFCGETLAGIFSVSDACRSGVEDAIKELKSLGIKTVMLTGDCRAAAMHAQEQLRNALDEVHTELLPEDKVKIIDQLKKDHGRTAMIGDGVNDAPALATADIGISMGISGSALATETGNIILMSNDIRKIPKALKLARKAHTKVIENVCLSIVTKSAILGLAFAGHPLVWAAVLADVGTCLLVILNSMLLLRGTHHHKHGEKCSKSSTGPHHHATRCSSTANDSSSHDHERHHHHGCNNGEFHSHNDHHNTHTHKHCLSGNKIEKVSQKCSSKCQTEHLRLNSSAKGKCPESNGGAVGDELREEKHCHGKLENCKIDYTDEETKKLLCISSQCHSNDKTHIGKHIAEESSGNVVESKCNYHCQIQECHGGPWTEGEGDNKSPHTVIDIEHNGHVKSECTYSSKSWEKREITERSCKSCVDEYSESATIHVCTSLEKREMGGCCKSYLKECCGKHGHYGMDHLSEIVTENCIKF